MNEYVRMCGTGQQLVRKDRSRLVDANGNATDLWRHVAGCGPCRIAVAEETCNACRAEEYPCADHRR